MIQLRKRASMALALLASACAPPPRDASPPVGYSTVTAAAPDALTPPDTHVAVQQQTAAVPARPPRAPDTLPACPTSTPSFVFPTDSAVVSPAQDLELHQLALCLTTGALRGVTVIAIGHTDAVGTEPVNLGLGLARAEKVKAFLVAHGVPRERILVTSAGERATAAQSAGRRVDLFFTVPLRAASAPPSSSAAPPAPLDGDPRQSPRGPIDPWDPPPIVTPPSGLNPRTP